MITKYATFGHGQPLQGFHIAFQFPHEDTVVNRSKTEGLMRTALQKYFNNHYCTTYNKEPEAKHSKLLLIATYYDYNDSFDWQYVRPSK